VAASRNGYALSSSQRRLWVLSQFEEGNVAYNIPGVYVLEGDLDRDALAESLAALVARHESLRTVFREDEAGEVRQFVRPAADTGFAPGFDDLRADDDREEKVKRQVQAAGGTPFDLANGPLLRAHLYRVETTGGCWPTWCTTSSPTAGRCRCSSGSCCTCTRPASGVRAPTGAPAHSLQGLRRLAAGPTRR
jgi:hypothetical protein